MKASIDIDPSSPTYAAEADSLLSACGPEGCDFVLLALLPDTAERWLAANPVRPQIELAGLSTLLTDGFRDKCFRGASQHCEGLVAWSGFVPFTQAEWWNGEAEMAYGRENGSVQVEGAAVAAMVLIRALDEVGPHATRAALRQAFDSLTFTSGATPTLRWPFVPLSQAWQLRADGFVPSTERPRSNDPKEAGNEMGERLPRGVPLPYWYAVGTGWVRDPG